MQPRADNRRSNGSRSADQNVNFAAVARRYVYVTDADQFWDRKARILVKPRAVVRRHADQFKPDENLMGRLLDRGGADKADVTAFLPGRPEIVVDDGVAQLNLWRPRGRQPRPGSARPFIRHVEYLLDGDPAAVGFVLDWLACLVQNPAVKPASALLLIGPPGVGKNVFARFAAEAVGTPNARTLNASDLYSSFNDWIAATHLAVVDEMAVGGDAAALARIKSYVTAERITVNPKGRPAYERSNHASFLLLSNDDDALKIAADDRRFFVWRSRAKPKTANYYARLLRWLDGGGRDRVLNFLLCRDLSRFNPFARPPATAARAELAEQGRSDDQTYLADAIAAGDAPFDRDLISVQHVLDYLRLHRNIRFTAKQTGAALRGAGAVELGQKRIGGGKLRLWALRDVDHWRNASEADIAGAYRRPGEEAPQQPATALAMPTRRKAADGDV